MNNLNSVCFKCCGCNLCSEVCPTKAITMAEDEEGFNTYRIDESKCIHCGLCIKKCPQNNYEVENAFEQQFYCAHINENEILKKSTSGGIFYAICESIVNKYPNNYAICGASYNKDLEVEHIVIDDIKDINKLMGSKYVQSNINGIYNKIKELLDDNVIVVFSGTPCQVSGLNFYLGKKYENLYTIDLICHGVPSPLLFKKYILSLENKYGELASYSFRNKDKNSWELRCNFNTKNKKYYRTDSTDSYYYNFIKGTIYRESCYNCLYARKERVGDLTLGDFWGAEIEHPNNVNSLGNSAIIINSKKGEYIFNIIKDKISYEESSYEKMSKMNHNLVSPSIRPDIRNNIYKDINNKEYDAIVKENFKFKKSFKGTIKAIIPSSIKRTIKSYLKKG